MLYNKIITLLVIIFKGRKGKQLSQSKKKIYFETIQCSSPLRTPWLATNDNLSPQGQNNCRIPIMTEFSNLSTKHATYCNSYSEIL